MLALEIFFHSSVAFARAGGAGGGSSGGGSSGGGFGGGGGGGDLIGLLFQLIFQLLAAGPFGWLILAFIVAIAIFIARATQNSNRAQAVYVPTAEVAQKIENRFSSAFPGESYQQFQEKVSKAFFLIQQSWSEQNLAHMRRFITDGVSQRFNAQFTMMKVLAQKNPITDVKIHGIQVAKVSRDGAYDCVDVMIQASATDQFVCEKFPALNTPGGNEGFTEFWTFVRRTDHRPGKDIFHNDSCPQCGAPLTDKLMDTARCPYCGTYLNNGEFDWVLAEITQEEDYGVPLPLREAPEMEDRGVDKVRALDPGFSVQLLEDKATNAFMEILIGTATNNPNLVKRFTTADAFALMVQGWPKTPMAFDRLYTKTVELLDAKISGTHAQAWVGVRYCFHRIDRGSNPQGVEMNSVVKVLALSRDYSGGVPKGSVYAGSCPHCGAPQANNLSPLCDHCSQPLNDQRLEWIVEGILDPAAFRARS
ncbi:MAG: TIM44-like domain-containing protein [Bdellovibrionota bacterium]